MTRRVLFVDDESNILDALQRMLRPLRREWEMRFVGGGAEALAVLAEWPADVLVTDMRMPGMDGDELLAEVNRLHPMTIRIVLTGQCSKNAMARLIPLAHRVLSKPCDASELKVVLQQACGLRDLLSNPSLAAIIGQLGGLPTLPHLYTEIVTELDKPDVSLAKVGELISGDMGVVAKLMQLANSALFGLRAPVSSPIRAVQVLGVEMTKIILLAANVFTQYDPSALQPFSIDSLWEHSRRVGELAGRIARSKGTAENIMANAALAGMLHDIGRLTLATQMPSAYKDVLQAVQSTGQGIVDVERQVLGATHAEVGAYLLGLWGLPEPVVEAVAWHHTPSLCPAETVSPLAAVHLAEVILGREEGIVADTAYIDRIQMSDCLEQWVRTVRGDG